jgi:hypothetical protein
MNRSSVDRLTAQDSLPATRAPGRPPRARATARSTASAAGVRRACLLVSPLTGSAHVTFRHSAAVQKNRRTSSEITTSRPAAAVSRRW